MVDNEKKRRSKDFSSCQRNEAMHGRELLQVWQSNFQTRKKIHHFKKASILSKMYLKAL
jgi:hypothetical protein